MPRQVAGRRLRQPDRRLRSLQPLPSAPDGQPLRPEIYAKEHSKRAGLLQLRLQVRPAGHGEGHSFPVRPRRRACRPGSLRIFLRTDRIAQFGVRYFMGMEGYTLEEYLELIRRYSAQPAGEPEGALIIFADDAEYVGTNGWFRLKYQNQPGQRLRGHAGVAGRS